VLFCFVVGVVVFLFLVLFCLFFWLHGALSRLGFLRHGRFAGNAMKGFWLKTRGGFHTMTRLAVGQVGPEFNWFHRLANTFHSRTLYLVSKSLSRPSAIGHGIETLGLGGWFLSASCCCSTNSGFAYSSIMFTFIIV
jgi:hypothetical protein